MSLSRLGTRKRNEMSSGPERRSKTFCNLNGDLSSASAVESCCRCIFGSSRWSAWLQSYCCESGASGHEQPPTRTKGSERRRSRHYVGCVATWTMGHELFLTQFEVGESISAIPSIITLPLCLRLRAPRARLDVYFYALINSMRKHKEVGTRLTTMSRGPGNVVGRCLKPLSASAKRGEHSLAMFERPAYFVHFYDRPPVQH